MTQRSHRVWLSDIHNEIEGIRGLTKDATADIFASSWAMQRAVQHALLIIAEAAKRIPPEMKELHPAVPWQKIHGLGNLLRHEYRRIDPAILWSIITDHLDELNQAVVSLLDAEGHEQ
jgi:uncharacterized protein with HEPN domain